MRTSALELTTKDNNYTQDNGPSHDTKQDRVTALTNNEVEQAIQGAKHSPRVALIIVAVAIVLVAGAIIAAILLAPDRR
ncbi:MAG: hypothetical protein S4CHLAM20_10100 [Chlamydiia bacterium]|nr:hypothetical protein [Chlamydiia bacterium]